MIVDDLRASNPTFRRLTQGAQVIRVPYEVCPATDEPDGHWGIWWRAKDELLSGRLPLTAHGLIACDWWRPPFPLMVIASEARELGAAVVLAGPHATDPSPGTVDLDGKRVAVDWKVKVALVSLMPEGIARRVRPDYCGDRVVPILAAELYAINGNLLVNSDVVGRETVASSWIFAGRSPDDDRATFDDVAAEHQGDFERKAGRMDLDLQNLVHVFAVTMALLNTKNIETEVQHPPQKLQRSRERKGELPLVSWRILKVQSHRARTASRGSATKGEPLALHWVRGHFKRYDEHPLFGAVKGVFWWSPHLSGRADRVALKDYEIEP